MAHSLNMLLTGCASGIGRHLTGVLAARGHKVVATDLDVNALRRQGEEHAWGAAVRTRGLDVRKEDDWAAAIDDVIASFGSIDVLLNIAGFLQPAYVVDIEARDIDLHIDVNVKGVVLGTRAAAIKMVAQRSGHIINFGSLASLAPVPGLSLYSASKFAVRGFSLAAATELKPEGVSVTLIMPDAVQTPMLDKQVPYKEAAMTFSGSKALTVEDIERLIIDRVLPMKPMEVALPLTRALAARLANTAPGLSHMLAPILAKKGMKAQERIKRKS